MYLVSVHLLIVIVGPPILAQKRNTALLQVLYNTVKVHFSAREKLCESVKTDLLKKFTRFLFMRLNVACITNIWCDNFMRIQIYVTAA